MASKRSVREWSVPRSDLEMNKLKLYNSFTKQKEEFVPVSGKRVLWYNCGPTVYDSAHMGHARSYITFDIIRRVLRDYFKYDLFYAMNITDIDDKIIKRARQQFLFAKYCEEHKNVDNSTIKCDILKAIDHYKNKLNAETDEDKKKMMIRLLENVENYGNNIEICSLKKIESVLSEWLDSIEGHDVNDISVFESLPRKHENEFYEDMTALNVLAPDVVTRVSEYVPEIIEYIKKICENGYAYESKGSVYFDTVTFSTNPKHQYAKLVPEAVGDRAALDEGEGVLSVSESKLAEKRHPNDFALWKASKPGEPFWESPWGKGRPGWHIECSVMASAVLGKTLDIHSGGYDLKFPHHDNEIAQAEAYYDTGDDWINYFLHSGHLTISGCKMSKSLKNFITIKEALEKHTSRQLRFAFLLHSWKDTLDYSENSMHDAINYEKFANEFFLAVKDIIRSVETNTFTKWSQLELDLNLKFHDSIAAVDVALCDNIDTRSALDAIKELISSCNIYMKSTSIPNAVLLKNIAGYITNLFEIFGLLENGKNEIGFSSNVESSVNREEVIIPLLDVLCKFREEMRLIGKEFKLNQILDKCDELRDDILPDLGIKIEDKEVCGVMKTVKKLVDREMLLKEKEERMKIEEEKKKAKEKRKLEQLQAQVAKEAQKKINPVDMFRNDSNYSQFDEKGFPIADKEGKPLSKSAIKNLTKLYQQQEKRYKEYLSSLNESNAS
ncbi:cysteine--tRNA ligase: cytoplasmic-like protein [Dinothrombium tinctorium]|uniref:Cysteine--tRNA ligase, cytoplasmic n=1 Tax=Dinothrombium tinctorium TaxID=1965070 RepID=A0A443R4J4_9ACAR|nr:cysteine--tRNA ligase: cytoplasmic-like protein [Dinothrombium tinctorium]